MWRCPEILRPAVLLLLASALGGAVRGGDAATPGTADVIRVLLVAQKETTLSSQMNGALGDIPISLGQRVVRGATLAKMDCRELNARVDVAQAELNLARQNLEAKKGLKQLNAAGELEVAMASTEVDKAQGALTLATTQSSYCRITAPYAARIARIHVKPYQTVTTGAPLFDVVSDGALKVRLSAPSAFMGRLKPGARIDISIHETGANYPATVSAVSARIDAVAQTVEMEATLDKENAELISGMSGVARLR